MTDNTTNNIRFSKLYKNEKKHNIIGLLLSVAVFFFCAVAGFIFLKNDYGYFSLVLPIFGLIASALKIFKNTILYKNLTGLIAKNNLTDLNFYVYMQWQRKKIGNTYISIFLAGALVYIYALYLIMFNFVWPTVIDKTTIAGFSLTWALMIAWVLLSWNFNSVWLNNMIERYSYFVKGRTTLKIELEANNLQANKDYKFIVDVFISMMTIVYGIYLLINNKVKQK